MPKIRIIEKDRTKNISSSTNDSIIFMVDSKFTNNEPKLITKEVESTEYDKLTNKEIIKQIIELGGQVLVGKDFGTSADYLKDRNQCDVKFILAKEVSGEGEAALAELKPALDIACYRRDCVVVYTKITETYSAEEKKLLSEQLDTKADSFFKEEKKDVKGKYVLPFYGKELPYDTGVCYIFAFLNSARTNAEWLAVAGSKRGEVPGINECGMITESAIDSMQPDGETAGEIAINPILKMNPWGVRVWGNRTAYPVGQSEDKKTEGEGLVASSFANIRIMLCDIKKKLYEAARKYQFEQNSDILWVNFTAYSYSLLEEMVQSYGIAGYKWYREEAKERAKLKARLELIPIDNIENFDLSVELIDSL